MQILNLIFNQISDISPLKNLTNLQILNLAYNQINNISELKQMSALKTLCLYKNSIDEADIKILSEYLPYCDIQVFNII